MRPSSPSLPALRWHATHALAWLRRRDLELVLAGASDRLASAVRSGLHACARCARDTVMAPLLRHLPYRLLLAGARAIDVVPQHRRDARRRAAFAGLNLYQAAGRARAGAGHARLWRHKIVLEAALYFRNRTLIQELEDCARQLAEALRREGAAGQPVILAPLHMHSDLLATLMCARACAGPVAVITAHDASTVTASDEALLKRHGGIEIRLLNPLDHGAGELLAFLRAVRNGAGTLVAFPDAPPEATQRLFERAMRTYDCRMFGHPARVHRGLPELARLTGARVLFVCLTRRGGRFHADVAACVPADRVGERMPDIIERAILARPHEWLFWHTPSLFSFNSADR